MGNRCSAVKKWCVWCFCCQCNCCDKPKNEKNIDSSRNEKIIELTPITMGLVNASDEIDCKH